TANPQTGQNVTITWTDANTGQAATAGDWTDRVTVVNTTTGQTLATAAVPYSSAGNGNVPAGGVSAPRAFTFRLPDGPAGAGSLAITVTADANNNVFESNPAGTGELNNSASTTAQSTLGPYPALSVTAVTVPAAATFNTSVSVTWTVLNSGDAPLTV